MAQILIVDDNNDLLPLLKRHLEHDGHKVEIARDLDEVRLLLERDDDVDLAILDFWLGKGTGIDAIRLLRHRFPSIPVLFLSGGGNGLDRLCCANHLTTEVPLSPERLIPRPL